MRLAVLTTETPHHAAFVRRLAAEPLELLVLVERQSLAPPYPTAHAFEAERDAHEQRLWFDGRTVGLASLAETRSFERVGDADGIACLRGFRPDAVVVFGTGRLKPDVIAVKPDAILNLHGGDPERYRGLDTHLWAIWHGEFSAVTTCLHRLSPELDAGDIVLQAPVKLRRGMALHELRAANTELCGDLVLAALDAFRRSGTFIACPQRQLGRYYSFMPSELKAVCVRKFTRYTERLP
jgi:methionyl-tRNA formyltransferase